MNPSSKPATYGNGHFGRWITDRFELPAYEYTCMQTQDPDARTLTTGPDSIDHWHQVGNDRITLTAHNGGYMQFFIANRGMQWISYMDKSKGILGGAISIIREGSSVWTDLYNSKLNLEGSKYKRIFGCGYFQKTLDKKDLKMEHLIYPPFGDDPVVISTISIVNNAKKSRTISVHEFWGTKIQSLIGSLLAMLIIPKERKKFGITKVVNLILRGAKTLIRTFRLASDQTRKRFSSKFSFESEIDKQNNCLILTPKYKGKVPVKKDERADRNYFVDPIFLASLNDELPSKFYNSYNLKKLSSQSYSFQKSYQNKTNSTPCLMIEHEISLQPGETKTLKFIFGTADPNQVTSLIDKYKKLVNEEKITENFKSWRDSLVSFKVDSDVWLNREVGWHAYYLRSALLFDSYYNNHYLPQGNAYTFLHGANGAVRDYVLFLIPMIYLNPQFAREMLEYIYRIMSPEGELPYALVGYGQNLGAIVHETSSDLHLFLLWGLLEYIFTTRDFKFLEKEIPYYPLDCKLKSSVLDRIELSLKFLFQRVGIGEHGMIKVGSGDWSDGISLLVKSRGALLKRGESTFNSAFTLYLIPLLIELLETRIPKVIPLLKRRYELLKKACLNVWNGRWFYRGWDGNGGPIGNDNIFLEHHPWLLLSNVLKPSQYTNVIKYIHKILDLPSKTGQYILYPPATVMLNILPGGWDVNGGIWHAMNFLLTWAYSKYDLEKGYQSLLKNSMGKRAEIYPNIWYGIWSGSDSYNAEYAPNPGHTFIHPATPQTDFPIMNLNLHANFLNSTIKLVGIIPTNKGLDIDPRIPLKKFQFRTPILTLEVDENEIKGSYKPLAEDLSRIRIKKPESWKENIKVLVDDQIGDRYFKIEEGWLIIEKVIPITGINFELKQE